jgi:hypothetical protein
MQRQQCKGKKKAERMREISLKVAGSFTLAAFDSSKPCNFCHPDPLGVSFSFVSLGVLRG